MGYFTYILFFIFSMALLAIVSFYSIKHREKLSQMEAMMIGMVMGMFSGLITATLYLIPTGDFLYGFIAGSLVGLFFGFFLGRLGGHLGVLEGIVAGPMGGMMGAMLGQMIRPFSIEVFIPFLMFIFLITMSALGFMIFAKARAMEEGAAARFFFIRTIPAIILVLSISIDLPFTINPSEADAKTVAVRSKAAEMCATGKTTSAESVQKGDFQEVELVADKAAFSPSTIYAKENIPLIIKASALKGAGCVGEIVFKDLGIKKIIPPGGSTTIEMGALKKGTYSFSCPMGMAPGKLVVQ